MEEKVLELLAQLHKEIKDIKVNMVTKDDIRKIEGDILRFENVSKNKFDALFDGYKQNTEAIHELRMDVNSLKAVVEQHEIKLQIVK